MDVYVPPDAPGDVEIPVIVQDGPVTRTGIWKGPKTKRLEQEIARIAPPPWTEKADDITEYLRDPQRIHLQRPSGCPADA